MPANTINQFKDAAESRLLNAMQLYNVAGSDVSHLSAACYLAGYAVEMLLKAALMKHHGKRQFSDFREPAPIECPICGGALNCRRCREEVTKLSHRYWHHNLKALMDEVGEFKAFETPVKTHKIHFKKWRETHRYDSTWVTDATHAQKFMEACVEFFLGMMGGLKA